MKRILPIVCGVLAIGMAGSISAQEATPFPPEATVMPEGAVFIAPGRCTVSPDESMVALQGYGVFNLSDGHQRYEFDRPTDAYPEFSPDGQYIILRGEGLLDAQTGELLLETSLQNPLFTPDSQFFIDDTAVYALPSLEVIVNLNQIVNMRFNLAYGEFVNNDRWFTYVNREGYFVFMDNSTWKPVLDVSAYGLEGYPFFSPDYTRYIISGVGMFSYPQGEKLFDVPSGEPEYSADLKTILFINGGVYTFIDGETGQHLNQFILDNHISEVDPRTGIGSLYAIGALTDSQLTLIALPDSTVQTFQGKPFNILSGWRLIEVRTNNLIKQWNATNQQSARDELGITTIKYHPSQVVNGRAVKNRVGVFDVATDTLIKPMDGLRGIYLTAGGSYVVSQNPCTVWTLP